MKAKKERKLRKRLARLDRKRQRLLERLSDRPFPPRLDVSGVMVRGGGDLPQES